MSLRSDLSGEGTLPVPPAVRPLLEAEGLTKRFGTRARFLRPSAGAVRAVDRVDLAVGEGEAVGIVGESGCGKTTLARLLLRLIEPTAGRIYFGGEEITGVRGRALRRVRRQVGMVFQDPEGSLDPRMTIGAAIAEPLRIWGEWRDGGRERVADLLERVGLRAADAGRSPAELSGGQRQRAGIARALALGPRLLICDEPVSSVDASRRAQILGVLAELQRDLGLAVLLISHDLAVVREICTRVAVMYLGRIVEEGPSETLFETPAHPYTQALLAAVPVPDPAAARRPRLRLAGEPPNPLSPPAGCAFHPRCPRAETLCRSSRPLLDPVSAAGASHRAACHFPGPDR